MTQWRKQKSARHSAQGECTCLIQLEFSVPRNESGAQEFMIGLKSYSQLALGLELGPLNSPVL